MSYVYRVELDGHGPYNNGTHDMWTIAHDRDLIPKIEKHLKHVEPDYEDCGWLLDRGLLLSDACFGCISIESLLYYLGEDVLKICSELGYYIIRYEVPDDKLIVGSYQVFFNKKYKMKGRYIGKLDKYLSDEREAA